MRVNLRILAAFCAVASTSAAWADPSPDLAGTAAGAMETVVVTGAKTVDVSKDSTPLVETPQDIQIISGDLISDQRAIKLDEALRNVAGVIPGSAHPDDVQIYSAHWDHLGIKPDVAGPDKIYNGAVDNGMGVSSVLELAEKFKNEPAPKRSVGFLFWTMEEQGLLGSEYFAEHPLWPKDHIVGVINTDANGPQPVAHDMSLPGNGQSHLEDYLAQALKAQGRVVSPDPQPEKGGFFRSDHFSLAKQGIPAISPGGGEDLVVGGRVAGKKLDDDYTDHRYHQPSDQWKANWDLSGPLLDLKALYAMGVDLANSDAWPGWYDGSEFKAARDKAMAGKKQN